MRSPGTVIHLSGVPASGKSTIATHLGKRLGYLSVPVEIIDADETRKTFFPELGFSRRDREENVRRNYELAVRLARHGVTAIMALIAPYETARRQGKLLCARTGVPLVLVHVTAPREVLEFRDPKGLYAKVASGELAGLTGIDDPFEPPINPDLVLDTAITPIGSCIDQVMGVTIAVRARGTRESGEMSKIEAPTP